MYGCFLLILFFVILMGIIPLFSLLFSRYLLCVQRPLTSPDPSELNINRALDPRAWSFKTWTLEIPGRNTGGVCYGGFLYLTEQMVLPILSTGGPNSRWKTRGKGVMYFTKHRWRAGVAFQATVENIRDFVWEIRGTQREYSSKPLKHRIVKRILVFKRYI